MSYSFSVRAANKAEAKEKAKAEFDKVVASQPVHAVDKDAALATVGAFVDMLVEPPEGKELALSVNGYVSWQAEGQFTSANVSVGCGHAAKQA